VIGEIARVDRFVCKREHRGLKQGKVPCRSEHGVGVGGARGFTLMEAFHQPSQRKSRVTNRGDPLGTCGERHDLAAVRQWGGGKWLLSIPSLILPPFFSSVCG
jgi:hypothetical protein